MGVTDIISALTICFPVHSNRTRLWSLTILQAVVDVGCLPLCILPVLDILDRGENGKVNWWIIKIRNAQLMNFPNNTIGAKRANLIVGILSGYDMDNHWLMNDSPLTMTMVHALMNVSLMMVYSALFLNKALRLEKFALKWTGCYAWWTV